MKKVIIVILLLVLTVFVVGFRYFSQPEVKDPAFIKSVTDDFEATWKAQQVLAKDKEKNGYWNPSLVSYWGRADIDGKKDSEAGEAISAWAGKYASLSNEEVVDHVALLESEDEEYTKSFEAFEKWRPALIEAFNKPHFLNVEEKIDFNAPIPNYIALELCCNALSGFVEHQMALGETREVLPTISALLNLSNNLAEDERMMPQLISVSTRRRVLDTINLAVKHGSSLSDQQWAKLTKILWQNLPPESNGTKAMRGELAGVVTSLVRNPEFVKSALQGSGEEGAAYFSIPGAAGRELRIFQNEVAPLFKSLDEGEVPQIVPTGYIASIVVPTFQSAESVISTQRKRMLATALATAVTAFYKSTGKYPEDIHALSEIGLSAPKDVDLEALGLSYQATEPVQVSIKLEPKEIENIKGRHADKHWGVVKDDKLVFSF